jgi:putative addiction module killer protein
MIEVRQTEVFANWLAELRDLEARDRILAGLGRLELGNPGDVKSVGEGVSEMRIDYGPGYRLYFTKCGKQIVLLLVGGNKSTQEKDVKLAQKLAKEIRDGQDH